MNPRLLTKVVGLTFTAYLLAACLGELKQPPLENIPPATLAPPPVNPTVAAAPRLSLNFVEQAIVTDQLISQIPHDLIGRSDCLMCHKHGIGAAPRIPDAHRGLDSNTCQTCHTAAASAELSGMEMYNRICSRCHGENGEGVIGPALNTKSYLRSATDNEIRAAILRGRGQGEMLAWGDLGLITDRQIDEMVVMIRSWEPTAPETAGPSAVEPATADLGDHEQGLDLFVQFCTGCHGIEGETAVGSGFVLREAVAFLSDSIIARGIRDGAQGMPSFHALLTTDDISDLLALMRTWAAGPPVLPTQIRLSGQQVFERVCARCHGQQGEGGTGPPLNSKEFLEANDDKAVREWIKRGTLGTSMMSWGDLGLLTNDQIEDLVLYIRAWEPTAPSTQTGSTAVYPPHAEDGDPSHGQQLFAQFCSGCHGTHGERQTAGIILNSEAFLGSVNDEILASQIQNGGREMPSFHAILTRQDVSDLLAYMRSGFTDVQIDETLRFSKQVLPVFVEKCGACHGTVGGWSATSYEDVINSGEHAPVVIPGEPEASLLVQKLQNTQTIGGQMPPGELLPQEEIDLVINWIAAGALDN